MINSKYLKRKIDKNTYIYQYKASNKFHKLSWGNNDRTSSKYGCCMHSKADGLKFYVNIRFTWSYTKVFSIKSMA